MALLPSMFQHEKLAELVRNENGQYNFICYDCGAYFDSGSNIIRHIEDTHLTSQILKIDINVTQQLYRCTNQCTNSYKFKTDLKEHMLASHNIANAFEGNIGEHRSETNTVSFECEHCSRTYAHQFRLDLHVKSHALRKANPCDNTRTGFDCGQCAKSFEHESSLNVHMNCVHKEVASANHKSDLLEISKFENESDEPGSEQTPADTVICQFCDRQFPPQFKFELHLRKHIEEIADKMPYKCEHCHKSTTVYESHFLLKKHFAMAHAKIDTTYKCERCNKEFWEYATFVRHLDDHNPSTVPVSFECFICHKPFYRKKNLLAHGHVHSDERKYRCSHCSFASKLGSTLKQHTRNIHMKNPANHRYRCDICAQSFEYRTTHMRHMLHHSGQKPFQCSICGLSFYTSSELTRHTKDTHLPTTYPCPKCDKIFQKSGRLQRHLQTHRTERLFYCEICGNYFKTACTLLQHKLIHDTIKRFGCRYCDQQFAQSSGRRSHERSYHNAV